MCLVVTPQNDSTGEVHPGVGAEPPFCEMSVFWTIVTGHRRVGGLGGTNAVGPKER